MKIRQLEVFEKQKFEIFMLQIEIFVCVVDKFDFNLKKKFFFSRGSVVRSHFSFNYYSRILLEIMLLSFITNIFYNSTRCIFHATILMYLVIETETKSYDIQVWKIQT